MDDLIDQLVGLTELEGVPVLAEQLRHSGAEKDGLVTSANARVTELENSLDEAQATLLTTQAENYKLMKELAELNGVTDDETRTDSADEDEYDDDSRPVEDVRERIGADE